jgi:hypothetical protein
LHGAIGHCYHWTLGNHPYKSSEKLTRPLANLADQAEFAGQIRGPPFKKPGDFAAGLRAGRQAEGSDRE